MPNRARIHLYYFATFASGIGRGGAIVVLAWTTLAIGDSMAAVGQVFVVSHVFNVVIGPSIGSFIDRSSRRYCALAGQIGSAFAMAIPMLVKAYGARLSIEHIYTVALLSAAASLVSTSALDGLFQAIVPVVDRRHVSATVGGVRQSAMVAGAGGAGFVIHAVGHEIAFLIVGICALATGVSVAFMPDSRPEHREYGYLAYFRNLREGVAYSLKSNNLIIIAFATSLSFSVGQLANALLPSFIRDDIGGASELYGIVDAAWSVGGIASAFLIAGVLKRYSARNTEFWSLTGLGIATVVFGFLYTPIQLIMAHAAMGAGFSATKVLCDGRLLEFCPENMIGRARTQIQALTSVFGILMYLSPTFVPTASARPLYIGWGAVVLGTGIGLWAWHSQAHRFESVGRREERV